MGDTGAEGIGVVVDEDQGMKKKVAKKKVARKSTKRAMDAVIAESVGEAAKVGRSDKIEVRDPMKAAVILERLARGDRLRRVMAEEGVGQEMIARLKLDHGEAIARRRELAAGDAEYLAERYRLLAEDKADQLADDPEAMARVNPKDLALSYGIYRDKASNLRGDATAVVEHKRSVSLEDAAAMIEAARKKVQGEAIDV